MLRIDHDGGKALNLSLMQNVADGIIMKAKLYRQDDLVLSCIAA